MTLREMAVSYRSDSVIFRQRAKELSAAAAAEPNHMLRLQIQRRATEHERAARELREMAAMMENHYRR